MSNFTDSPEPLHLHGIKYALRDHLRWEIGRQGSGIWLVVPKGYIFDVSVPWWLRWLINPHQRELLLPAALHDFVSIDGWEWQTCAGFWHHALRAMGMHPAKSFLYFLAVSFFTFFRKKTKDRR